MGAIAPVVTALTAGAKILGAVSTIGNLLGGSQDQPSYLALPAPQAAAEPVEAPEVATEDTALQADTTTAEEAARQRALRRKKASQQNTILNPRDSGTSSVLTASLFGE